MSRSIARARWTLEYWEYLHVHMEWSKNLCQNRCVKLVIFCLLILNCCNNLTIWYVPISSFGVKSRANFTFWWDWFGNILKHTHLRIHVQEPLLLFKSGVSFQLNILCFCVILSHTLLLNAAVVFSDTIFISRTYTPINSACMCIILWLWFIFSNINENLDI